MRKRIPLLFRDRMFDLNSFAVKFHFTCKRETNYYFSIFNQLTNEAMLQLPYKAPIIKVDFSKKYVAFKY